MNLDKVWCTQLTPITDSIARRGLGLFGHVARMNNGIPARDAWNCTLARRTEIRPPHGWKRSPGRPRWVRVQQTDYDWMDGHESIV